MLTLAEIVPIPCDRNALAQIRQKIIDGGKHQYTNEEHRLRSARTITLDDAVFLYKITLAVAPKRVVEIGTWFGTSAAIMTSAYPCEVYTCDRNNVFCAQNDRIHFYNMQSDRFLKKMIKKGLVANMVFIDANLRKGDAEKLRKIMPKGVFVIHDYISGEKGDRAVAYLKGAYGSALSVWSLGEVAIAEAA